MLKIVGVARRSGIYEGSAYDNLMLYTTKAFESGKGTGLEVKIIKVKFSVLCEIFGKQLSEKEIANFVGNEAVFYYDEYKNVNFIQFEKKQ
jgi:hypothetical protein